MADQRKLRQNVGLENMNMTTNCDVTNNAQQIQKTTIFYWMNPPYENFLRRGKWGTVETFLDFQP